MNKLMITFLLTLLITSQAFAFGGPKGNGDGGAQGGFGKILKELNLTDEQKEKLKEFRQEKKAKRGEMKDEMKAKHENMKAAFISSKTSEADLKKFHDEMKAMKTQRMDERFNHMMKIRSVLNEEQRAKFFELQHDRKMGKYGKSKGKGKGKNKNKASE